MKKSTLELDLAFLRFLEIAKGARDLGDLTQAFGTLLGHFGYDRFIISDLTGTTIDERESQFSLVHNYPVEWMDRYLERHYVDSDPVYLKGLRRTPPFSWAEARQEARHPRSVRVMDEAADFGLRAGAGFTLTLRRGRIVGFGLASSFLDPRDDVPSLELLKTAAFSVRSALEELSSPAQASVISLSPREREVLQGVSMGRDEQEMAATLGISEADVRRHCEGAAWKLGTHTLAYAVAKALRLGLIS